MKQNKFKIVIPSYNNSKWVEYNIASILNQTYENYDVLYIDDASVDGTYELVNDIIQDIPNWSLVRNPENMKRGFNVSPQCAHLTGFMESDEDILIFVDGDDWLADDDVLFKLNEFYNTHNPWMTYGTYVNYPDYSNPMTQNTKYPEYVQVNKLYRKDVWRASHLRTFKWSLYKRIKLESQLDPDTGKFFYHAEDLATSFPCLEMCPPDKIGVVEFIAYVFNHTMDNNKRSVARTSSAEKDGLETKIRNQHPYDTLQSL
jgi:glycosyltransferase involved in cell wall biosynthesis